MIFVWCCYVYKCYTLSFKIWLALRRRPSSIQNLLSKPCLSSYPWLANKDAYSLGWGGAKVPGAWSLRQGLLGEEREEGRGCTGTGMNHKHTAMRSGLIKHDQPKWNRVNNIMGILTWKQKNKSIESWYRSTSIALRPIANVKVSESFVWELNDLKWGKNP